MVKARLFNTAWEMHKRDAGSSDLLENLIQEVDKLHKKKGQRGFLFRDELPKLINGAYEKDAMNGKLVVVGGREPTYTERYEKEKG